MALQETILNSSLDTIAGRINSVSLHTGDPGTTGTNELTGGGYSRQTPSWGSASSAAVEVTAPLVFSIAAGNEIQYVGFWEGTTWMGFGALSEPEQYNNDGQLTIQELSISATST